MKSVNLDPLLDLDFAKSGLRTLFLVIKVCKPSFVLGQALAYNVQSKDQNAIALAKQASRIPFYVRDDRSCNLKVARYQILLK